MSTDNLSSASLSKAFEEMEADVKEAKDKRSKQQGVVRGYVNKINAYMNTDEATDCKACSELLKKLPDALERFEEMNQHAVETLERYNKDTSDLEEKARVLTKEVRAALLDGPKWLYRIQCLTDTATEESSELDVTVIEGASGFGADISRIPKSVEPSEVTIKTMSSMLASKNDEINYLGDQMKTLARASDKQAEHFQGQIEDLKRALEQTSRASRDEADDKDRSIDSLKKEVRDLRLRKDQLETEMQTSTPRRTRYSDDPREEATFGETSMTQGDMLAISSIIGQNNSSIFQKILEETSVRQKEFYTHLSGPKTELRRFDGDRTNYYTFVNSYDELVGKSSRSYTSKLATLLEHCDKSVVTYLDCCNYKPPREGYEMARKILLDRYGDPYLIAQAWIEKLMAFPKMKSGEQMSQFAAILSSAHETLKSVGYASELSCTRTMRDIFEKLPFHVQNKWLGVNREKAQKGRKATLQEMQDLIQNAAMEMSDPIYSTDSSRGTASNERSKKKEPEKAKNTAKKSYAADKKTEKQREKVYMPGSSTSKTKTEYTGDPCVVCKKDHPTYRCFLYKELGANERLQFVKDNGLCLCCIDANHKSEECPRNWKCLMNDCEESHHYSLHRALTKKPKLQVKEVQSRQDEEPDDVSVKSTNVCKMRFLGNVVVKPCYMGLRLNPDFALPVVPIVLSDDGREYTTWALMDTGSAITMINKNVVKALQLKPVAHANIVLQGILSEQDMITDVVDLSIQGMMGDKKEYLINVIVNDQMILGSEAPHEMRRYKEWEHLAHLNLLQHEHNKIDMIIGQDQAFLLVQKELIAGPNKYYPWGVKTPLGWTMFGHFAEKMQHHISLTSRVEKRRIDSVMTNDELDVSLSKMWEIEKIPEAAGHSPINKRILKRWDRETVLKDGHYYVPIPFKKEPPCLPNNYEQVKRRLESLTRRLNKDEVLKKQYVEAMAISKSRGILEKAPLIQDPEYLWFNTHLPVISETRSTKCRIVGNASQKCKNVSLNDVVHQGPNLATPLVQVMVSFRVHPYVITGDIEKMFNQVKVPEKQRDCLSLLWYKNDDTTQEIEILRNQTQMFGGTWAPAASMYAMGRAADDFGHLYDPIVKLTVQKNFYVDDLLKSILSISIGIRLIVGLRELLGRVGFNLIKLGSNSMEILDSIPDHLKSKNYEALEFNIGQEVQDSTLGTLWRPGDDVFGFKCIQSEKPATRRGLLSTYSSVYDPLGFVGPFVLLAKMIIQELCRLQLPWDENIPVKYVEDWLKWKEQLPELQSFSVNRWLEVRQEEENEDYQLHVFSDASEAGYGAVAYLCVLNEVGTIVKANLVMSKCRVAPIKSMTIPRMELTAAVTAAKLENSLVKYLDVPLLPSVFWIDSQIVLFYIKQQSREFKTFVANRVATIHELTEPSQWRFVPGVMNIADVASRGLTVQELVKKDEWLNGPTFLYDSEQWPEISEEFQELDSAEFNERKRLNKIRCYTIGMSQKPVDAMTKLIDCFSEWNKLVRVVALLKKMIRHKTNFKKKSSVITVDDYTQAERIILIHVQRKYITIKQKESKSFKNMFPFDDEGVYRVGGRLMLSQLRFEEKHPMIFPCSPQAEMYVRHVHVRLGHPGVDRTSQEVRLKYWMLGGRRYIKQIVNKCVYCKKLKGKFYQQKMAPLPELRITQGTAPFEHIGVDYCGPISVKIGRSMVKRYICVITCFQSRAMHLEMAGDLSTSSFLNALQRFISRRGRPMTIKSDNGTNFVGAKREINELIQAWNQKQIHKYLLQQKIDWSFNTPGASHHGGVWERQIRSIRGLMMSLVKDQVLTDESLNTYLCVIEEIVNSRPLAKMSQDSQELMPITPNHLLMLRQTSGLVGDYEKADTLQKRWKQLQFLADLFWKRWTNSYLKDLQSRSKWLTEHPNVKKGDIVLMMNEQLPRMSWPMGIVEEVFPGIDGLVRSVRVKTEEGRYERPITKLVPLECT